MSILKHHIAGPIIDMAIRSGLSPMKGQLMFNVYRHLLKDRDCHIPKSHPLAAICADETWNTTFALSRAGLAWMWYYLEKISPKVIIDIGGGRSTLMLAEYARVFEQKNNFAPTVISIEHDISWHTKTLISLSKFNLNKFVEQCCVPLVPCELQKHRGKTYDFSEVESVFNASLIGYAEVIIIDGPPGGEINRLCTLRDVLRFVKTGGDIFFDDVLRSKDRELINLRISETLFDASLLGIFPFGSGYGWIRKNG